MKVRYLAWVGWIVFVTILCIGTYYGFNPEREGVEPIRFVDAVWAWSFLGFPTTGALIATRFPKRPLGWLFILAPLLIMGAIFISDPTGGVLPEAGPWMIWLANVFMSAGLAILMLVPFYLPSGVRERRLRLPFRIVVGCIVGWILGAAFTPGPLAEFRDVENPAGIDALDSFFALLRSALGPILFLCVALGIGSIIARYRRSEGQERFQLKWLAMGVGTIPLVVIAVYLIERVFGDLTDTQATIPFILAILAIPTSIAIGMLKHRLFEIDQVINRAIVYTLVTTLLVGAYLGLIVALRTILDPVTPDSDLAIAASTLAVAAVFRPLRTRIQGFIDRRFYRRKYDAGRTVEEMRRRLRDHVAIDAVEDDVLTAVRDTVQPTHAFLWLKTGGSA